MLTADRAANIHCARVYLGESRRRGKSNFAFVLLEWTGNARHRAMEIKNQPTQGDLFGGEEL